MYKIKLGNENITRTDLIIFDGLRSEFDLPWS